MSIHHRRDPQGDSSPSSRRRHQRFDVHRPAAFCLVDSAGAAGLPVSCGVRDISQGGACVVSHQVANPGDILVLMIEAGPKAPEVAKVARVVSVVQQAMGIVRLGVQFEPTGPNLLDAFNQAVPALRSMLAAGRWSG